MSKRKVCIVTGSRADYGHLLGLMQAVAQDSDLHLQILVSGSHLAKEQGETWRLIKRDGFFISGKVPILKFDDSDVGIAKRIGLGCQGFSEEYKRLKPDVIVLLGDRYETLAAAIAAYVLKIPVAHLHGGETSQGALDEGFRHAITKLSQYHFTATARYRRRVIQLGESPKRVFDFGAPGLDLLHKMNFLNKEELSNVLNFDLEGKIAIVTYHPESLSKVSAQKQIACVLTAIRSSGIKALFTKANTDPLGEIINDRINVFCRKNSKAQKYKFVDNLGQKKYFSCLKTFDLMIGNSSSGLLEAPTFKMPVVNVGDRQRGRMRARNVIDAANNPKAIKQAIAKAVSVRFRKSLSGMKNPYDRFADGKACLRIKDALKRLPLNETVLKKEFFDYRGKSYDS